MPTILIERKNMNTRINIATYRNSVSGAWEQQSYLFQYVLPFIYIPSFIGFDLIVIKLCSLLYSLNILILLETSFIFRIFLQIILQLKEIIDYSKRPIGLFNALSHTTIIANPFKRTLVCIMTGKCTIMQRPSKN